MERPERIRKKNVRALTELSVHWLPFMKTISQEKSSTTIVRSAVAVLESVSRIPIFASIDVIPAKRAEPKANIIHI